jgi:hypothetical protein
VQPGGTAGLLNSDESVLLQYHPRTNLPNIAMYVTDLYFLLTHHPPALTTLSSRLAARGSSPRSEGTPTASCQLAMLRALLASATGLRSLWGGVEQGHNRTVYKRPC